MKVELTLVTHNDLWPRCLIDSDRRCGEVEPGKEWQGVQMCDTPSCHLRCAIRDALRDYKKAV